MMPGSGGLDAGSRGSLLRRPRCPDVLLDLAVFRAGRQLYLNTVSLAPFHLWLAPDRGHVPRFRARCLGYRANSTAAI